MQDAPNQRIYEFGHFRLDGRQRLVEREGEVLPLTPKMVETLLALVERGGNVVDKDTLMERVWPGTFVEESNLTYNISVLRKVLRQNNGDQNYIETLPRRGYRFTCPVRELMSQTPLAEKQRTDGSEAALTESSTVSRGDSIAFPPDLGPVAENGNQTPATATYQNRQRLISNNGKLSDIGPQDWHSSRSWQRMDGCAARRRIQVLPNRESSL